jgi:hypothetical protein
VLPSIPLRMSCTWSFHFMLAFAIPKLTLAFSRVSGSYVSSAIFIAL